MNGDAAMSETYELIAVERKAYTVYYFQLFMHGLFGLLLICMSTVHP
jgi:hypothetical protein